MVTECARAGDKVFALSRRGTADPSPAVNLSVDLRDGGAVAGAVATARPDVVYHLAALSSVGRSWEQPARTLTENLATAANLLEAVRCHAPSARVVWVSSCEVYGAPATLPVPESAPLAPANPYAVSKAGAELLTSVYADAYRLEIVRARPFSHSGPGQLPIFLLSSLAHQAAEARLSGATRVSVATGNPNTRRDFTDVRDVVRAYRLLASDGAAGAVYNVSSGRSLSAADQVALLAELLAPIEVAHEVDPTRIRAHEVMDLRGDHSLLTRTTGWAPEIPLRRTLADTIAYWERTLSLDR